MSPQDVEQIKKICEERKIDTLCHFTNVKHLSDILRVGLVPRSEVLKRENGISIFYPVDDERRDGHPNASCLSISFPNYQMFWRYQKKYSLDRYCVLLFSADILWKKGCAFYTKNAADHDLRELHPQTLHNAASFESMFYEESRPAYLPSNYPTNPQAEVLVFGKIEPSYIKKVVFNDNQLLAEAEAMTDAAKITTEMSIDYSLFNYRVDWSIWRRSF